MNLYVEIMSGFAFSLVLIEPKCNSEMAYWMNVENVVELKREDWNTGK